MRTSGRSSLAVAALTLFAVACAPDDAEPLATKVATARAALTTVVSYDFENGLSGWTAATTSGTSSWQVLNNPQTLSVSSALNPFSVTLADTGAHLAPPTGNAVVWFGHTANGTFIGNPFPAQNAKQGGTSAAVQTGTLTSPAFSLSGAAKAQLEFDSWWEIEGTAAASFDLMTVLVSTDGTNFTQLARLNPSFAAAQPNYAAYSSGGPAAAPVWRHYVYDLSAYAGQGNVRLRFTFDSRDTAYNAFRGFTVDNVSVARGAALPGPTITAVTPNVATANDLVTIQGSGFLGGATFTIGTTTITAANITQFGANEVIFKVPTMAAGTYPVKVVNVDGQQFTLNNAFTYSGSASPTVTAVAPATANINQSQGVVVTGTNFVNGATVKFGDTPALSVIWNSATQLTVMAPGLVAGSYNVVVTNPSSQSGTRFAAYTVADTSTLTLTSPNGGQSWAAGSTQHLTWTQSGGTTVNLALYKNGAFVGDLATGVAAALGTWAWTIPVTTAAGTDYRVRIYNPAGTATATSAANFTITASPAITPTVTLTSPVNPSSVGQALTFTATFSPSNLLGTVQFSVDGVDFGGATNVAAGAATSAPIDTLTPGPHTVTAKFTGTPPYANVNASLTQQVGAAPVANAQSRTTAEDTAVAITLVATDPDDGALTYQVVSGPAHGTLSGTAPHLTYTPDADYFGSDAFTFKANDGTFDSNVATVSITVTPVNDAPVATPATYAMQEDGALALTLSASDVDGDALTFTVGAPSHGTLTGTAPDLTYTPNANYFGADAFTFTVSDGALSASATVTIHIAAVNDAPVAVSSNVTTAEDTAVAITLLASDVDGDALTFTVGAPAHGTLSGAAPNLVYTPNADFHGADAFTFSVSDGALSASATVTIVVTAVNDAPVTSAASVTTQEDTAVAITLVAGDVDGDALTFNVGAPAHGTLTGTAPDLTYTPSADFHGADSFTFSVSDGALTSNVSTVSITVTPVNDAPVADDQSVTTQEDTAVALTLTGSDVDGDALTFSVGAPSHGTLSGAAPNLTYEPNADFHGVDSFTFTVKDGALTSAPATVTITVTAVNDAPVADATTVTTAEDTAVLVALVASDVDGDALTWNIGSPAHGALSGAAPNMTYTPNADFHGTDSFTFTVSDGALSSNVATVTITVTPVNDAPVADAASVTTLEDTALAITLTGSDVDGDALTFITGAPSHGTLSGAAPNLTYTPNADFNGVDAFTFTVSDGALTSAPATVTITVTAVNDAPVAHAADVTTDEDTALAITLSAEDADGDPLTWNVGAPSHGTLSGSAPHLTYTPNADYFGSDAFTFTVSDGALTSSPATVTITITAVNDAPVAAAASVTTLEDTALAITLGGRDVENSPLTFAIASQPSHGTLSGTGAQRVYTPNANYNGSDSFTFTVNDGALTSAPATVTITVVGENDAPVAMNGSVTTDEDTAVAVTLHATDVDDDALTYTIVTPPAHGTLTGAGPQRVYLPNANFHGADSFTFLVNDGELDSAIATVTISVSSVNDAPVAAPATIALDEDTEAVFTLLADDADGDALTWIIVTPPQHGTLGGTLPGVRYLPNADYNGDDTFTFKVNDGTVDSDVATVTLQIAPINDAPVATAATLTIEEDEAVDFTLEGTDVDHDTLSFFVVDPPAHGTLTGAPPALTYTPNASFNGTDSFTFKATDGLLESATATVTFTITPVNDAPVAAAQAVTLEEDTAAAITLVGSDVDGDALTFTIVSGPQHGTLAGDAPNLVYTPHANFHGSDAFTFVVTDGELTSAPATVSLTVTSVDDAPVADAQSVTTAEDTAVAIVLTGSDVDGDALTFAIASPPSHGTLSGAAPNVTYTPDADYEGSDGFTFVAIANGVSSAPARVSLTITAVNDAPVARAPSFTVDEDLPAQLTLLAHDPDGDTLTWTIVTPPQHGTLTGTAPHLTYTPDADYFGPDSFSFTVSDGHETSEELVVRFTVNAVNDAPVADAQTLEVDEDEALPLELTATDVENDALTFAIVRRPAHGTLTGDGADFIYTPNADFNGDDSFTFEANDGQVSSAEQIIRITVHPVNDAPIAISQRITAREDTATNAWLTGRDVDGDALTFTITQQPRHGVLSGSAPSFTYTPNADFHGDDAFTFIVNDGQLDSAPATVSIEVGGVNDAPVARDASATVEEDGEVAITLTADDVDGDALTFAIVSGPRHGRLTGSGADLIYTPEADFNGSDRFTFRANDGLADSQVATISITVTPVDDAPTASAQRVSLMQDTATEVKLRGEDPEGAELTWTITVAPQFGTLSGEAPNLVYKPAPGFSGDDSFGFTVTADGQSSQPATVSIHVMKAEDSFTGGGVGCSSTGGSAWGWVAALIVALAALRRRRSRAVVLAAATALPLVAHAQEQALALPRIDSQSLHLNAGAADSLVTQGGLLLERGTFRGALAAQYEYEPLMFTRNGRQVGAIVGHRLSSIATLAYAPLSWLEVTADLPVALYQRGDDLTGYGLAQPTSTAFGSSLVQVRAGVLQQRRDNPIDLTVGVGLLLPLGDARSVTSEAGVGFVPRIGVGRQLLHWLRVGGDVGLGLRPQSSYAGQRIDRNALEAAVVVHTMNLPVNAELSYRFIGSLGGAPVGSELLVGARGAFAKRFEAFAVAGMGLGSGAGTPAFRAIAGVSVSFDFSPAAPAPVVAPTPVVLAAPEPTPAPEPVVEAAPEPAPVVEATEQVNEALKEAMVGTQLFKADSFVIDDSALPTIERVVKTVNEGPASQRVRVEGFTDASGPREWNLTLSKRRAEVVRQALVERGIAAERIEAIGVGPDRPIASNDTREGREANRRFEITLVP